MITLKTFIITFGKTSHSIPTEIKRQYASDDIACEAVKQFVSRSAEGAWAFSTLSIGSCSGTKRNGKVVFNLDYAN